VRLERFTHEIVCRHNEYAIAILVSSLMLNDTDAARPSLGGQLLEK
jgi:hypothetical protein